MADEHKKPQGLNGPIANPHAAGSQPPAAWQNILAGAAAGMAGQGNPYVQQLQQQQAQQAQALQNARASQAAQLANYQNTAQAHQQSPAVQQAAIQAAAHSGPAPGGLAGNPLAPNAQQQVQQMGQQAAQQLTPEQLKQQQLAAAGGNIAMSDERLKNNIDRAGIDREFRRFFDGLGGGSQPQRRSASYDDSTLAGRAMRRG